MGKSVLLTDDNFQNEINNSETPVLIDFWAEWCGPCRRVSPIVEEIAEEYGGRLRVGKLNVDENPRATSQYGIRSIPTLIVFKNGEPVDRIIGAVPKRHIVEVVEKALTSEPGSTSIIREDLQ
jgi:thioredoxin 1